MPSASARLFPWLMAFALIMSVLDFYRGWRVFFLFLLGMYLLERWWVQQLRRGLRLHRATRFSWAQVGDYLEERFTLENHSLVPALWVEVYDQSTFLHAPGSRITGISAHSHARWQARHACTRRGVFTLGPTRVITSGPFGLLSLSLDFPAYRTLLVTPPIVPLPSITIAAGGRSGEGRAALAALEPTVSAAGVRPYTPGESMRHVHWRTSARRGRLYVRRFEHTPASDWWLLLDLDSRAHYQQGEASTLEHAITLTASLAVRGLSEGHAVGLSAHGKDLIWLPPAGTEMQRQHILHHLALAEAAPRALETLLTRLHAALPTAASLVIITASSGPRWLPALLPLLRRGIQPTILLIDAGDFGAPPASENLLPLLKRMDIQAHRIPRRLLERPEARPGRRGQWAWKVTPLGRAIPAMPEDIRWTTEA